MQISATGCIITDSIKKGDVEMIRIFIIAVIVVIAAGAGIFWVRRRRRFRPNPDKKAQQEQLNAALKESGFAYDDAGDYFYARRDCWQRDTGYCRLYDEGAPLFNMIMDCEPIQFAYAGKRWLIELWKGQYGMTTGAEVGIYNTSREDVHSEKFTGTFYEAAADDEQLEMMFVLRKNGKEILKRRDRHWWLTGFKLGEFSQKDQLTLDVKIKFPDRTMCAVFMQALSDMGYQRNEFSVRRNTVRIHYTKPHTAQPPLQDGIHEDAVQAVNRNNCILYRAATTPYESTCDKLEFLKDAMPDLYGFMLHSLYAHDFYAAFEWLFGLVRPPKPPKPPHKSCPACKPCPPVEPGGFCKRKREGETSCQS